MSCDPNQREFRLLCTFSPKLIVVKPAERSYGYVPQLLLHVYTSVNLVFLVARLSITYWVRPPISSNSVGISERPAVTGCYIRHAQHEFWH